MKTFFLFTLSILWLVFSVFAADATPKTVTASSSNGSLLWPTNFFSANSNAIWTVLGGRETGVLAIDRGGTGTTNAAGVRGVLGLDVGDPGSMGTNWLTLTTAAEGRGVLGLDVAAPGALGTNLLTQATAGGVRGLIGLDAGAPGALGTNLLTQATSGGVRGLVGLDAAAPGSYGTNWLTLSTVGSARTALGLDEAGPGALGTNWLVLTTAAGGRSALGLDVAAPGAMGTNILTQSTAAGVRSLIGLDAGDPAALGTNWLTLAAPLDGRSTLGLGEFTTNSVPLKTGNHSTEAALDVDEVLGDAGVRFKYGTNEYMLMLYGTNLNLVSALDGSIPSYVASPGEAALLTYKSLTNLFVLKTNDYGVLPLLASDPVEIATNTYSRIYTKVGQKSRATLFGQVLEPVGVTNLASEVVMVGPDAVATVDTIILGSTNIIEGIAGKQPYDAQLDQWATVGTNSVTALGVGALVVSDVIATNLTTGTVTIGATNVVAAISGKQDADAQLDEWASVSTNSVTALGVGTLVATDVAIGATNVVAAISGKQPQNVVADLTALAAYSGAEDSVLVSDANTGGTFARTTGLAADGVIVVTNTAAGSVFLRRDVTMLRPEWFGAVVNDGLDDSTAIQAAIDKAAKYVGTNAVAGYGVQFSSGYYNLQTTLTVTTPMHLSGVGARGSTLVVDAAIPAITYDPTSTAGTPFTVKAMMILGGAGHKTDSTGIYGAGAETFHLYCKDVTFYSLGVGIDTADRLWLSSIEDCTFACGTFAVRTAGALVSSKFTRCYSSVTGFKFNTIAYSTFDSVYVDSSSAAWTVEGIANSTTWVGCAAEDIKGAWLTAGYMRGCVLSGLMIDQHADFATSGALGIITVTNAAFATITGVRVDPIATYTIPLIYTTTTSDVTISAPYISESLPLSNRPGAVRILTARSKGSAIVQESGAGLSAALAAANSWMYYSPTTTSLAGDYTIWARFRVPTSTGTASERIVYCVGSSYTTTPADGLSVSVGSSGQLTVNLYVGSTTPLVVCEVPYLGYEYKGRIVDVWLVKTATAWNVYFGDLLAPYSVTSGSAANLLSSTVNCTYVRPMYRPTNRASVGEIYAMGIWSDDLSADERNEVMLRGASDPQDTECIFDPDFRDVFARFANRPDNTLPTTYGTGWTPTNQTIHASYDYNTFVTTDDGPLKVYAASTVTSQRTSLAATTKIVDESGDAIGNFDTGWTVGASWTTNSSAVVNATGATNSLSHTTVTPLVGPQRFVTMTLVSGGAWTVDAGASLTVIIGGNVMRTFTNGDVPSGTMTISGMVDGSTDEVVFTVYAPDAKTVSGSFDNFSIVVLAAGDFLHRHAYPAAALVKATSETAPAPYFEFSAAGTHAANGNAKDKVIALVNTTVTSAPSILATIPSTDNNGSWRLKGKVYAAYGVGASDYDNFMLELDYVDGSGTYVTSLHSTDLTGDVFAWNAAGYFLIGANADTADGDVTINTSSVEYKP